MSVDYDDVESPLISRITLCLDGDRPTFVMPDGRRRRSVAPQLFDTDHGRQIAFAEDWQEQLRKLFPTDLELEAARLAAVAEFGLADRPGEPPTMTMLIAMTLEV